MTTEHVIVASVLADHQGESLSRPGPCTCTALAYAPDYWDSVEAGILAKSIVRCAFKGWHTKRHLVRAFVPDDYRDWIDHPTFGDHNALPLLCVEGEAKALIPHYKSKRLIQLVATAHEKMLAKPESAPQLAMALKLELEGML